MVYSKIINIYFLWVIIGGCSRTDAVCHDIVLEGGDISIFIQPLSTSSIIESEMKRGILEQNKVVDREIDLRENLNFKVRIISNNGFNETQKQYLENDIKNDFILMINDDSLTQSLFINESSLSKEKIVQYVFAFNLNDRNASQLKLRFEGSKLGLQSEEVNIHLSCFE